MGPFFEEFAMEGVTVVDHPLVQHKLTLLRDKSSSTKSFRELLKEIGMLLCYEVTRDLPLTEVEVETPLARMQSAKIAGKKLVFVPVLRAVGRGRGARRNGYILPGLGDAGDRVYGTK
jgi:uracil phosphoribosyltransferase